MQGHNSVISLVFLIEERGHLFLRVLACLVFVSSRSEGGEFGISGAGGRGREASKYFMG